MADDKHIITSLRPHKFDGKKKKEIDYSKKSGNDKPWIHMTDNGRDYYIEGIGELEKLAFYHMVNNKQIDLHKYNFEVQAFEVFKKHYDFRKDYEYQLHQRLALEAGKPGAKYGNFVQSE